MGKRMSMCSWDEMERGKEKLREIYRFHFQYKTLTASSFFVRNMFTDEQETFLSLIRLLITY